MTGEYGGLVLDRLRQAGATLSEQVRAVAAWRNLDSVGRVNVNMWFFHATDREIEGDLQRWRIREGRPI